MSKQKAYATAGVNIDAADLTKRNIKMLVRGTFGPEVLTDIGGFGGLFAPNWKDYKDPVLVSSADGVGTKLKIAFMTGIHNTVGADLVSHCANDILVQGARPLFFMDYLAMGQHNPEVATAVIEGVANGCKASHCALLGGEMAEMPDFYVPGEYDLAGTIVGMVDREAIITGAAISAGDALIGLASDGLHTNGYSLARKLLFDSAGWNVTTRVEALGTTVGEALLAPHRSYVSPVFTLRETVDIRGLAHITGGGLKDNLPRILPDGLGARIHRGSWPELPIFKVLQDIGEDIETHELFQVFNMGIGMVVVVPQIASGEALKILQECGERAYMIGEVVSDVNRAIHIA
ncbi:MAG: phosphoribosylformylglycinamidine cyclo-ligase [bacterium]|jgi:phosphoribosylformylglycinamidine cyclo-ligase|nr:phosphoribosylformylglycinamidine cyclo-ligase [bacterium]